MLPENLTLILAIFSIARNEILWFFRHNRTRMQKDEDEDDNLYNLMLYSSDDGNAKILTDFTVVALIDATISLEELLTSYRTAICTVKIRSIKEDFQYIYEEIGKKIMKFIEQEKDDAYLFLPIQLNKLN